MIAETLSASDCVRLATLHVAALPDSIVSELGAGYAARFYRYLERSEHEQVFILRNEQGQIRSGCVLSLRPNTLRRRLLWHTLLLLYAGPWLLRRRRRRTAAPGAPPANALPAGLPELILIFTAPEARSRGSGTVLLAECEAFLAARHIPEYVARTVDEPGNRALEFYARNGFVAWGHSAGHGRVFRVFRKPVPARVPADGL